jgi:CheY-like chemotaxis protein
MSPVGSRTDGWADLPHVARLTKPVKASALAEALVAAVEGVPGPTGQASDGRARAALQQLRILVVEDNPVNQKVAVGVLARLGCRADVAGNGVEALEAIRRQPYDAILMDVQMPEMDGIEATRRIRAELPPERQPCIVALTANAMAEDRERCLAAGMDDYLSKPLRSAQLVAALAGCCPASTVGSVAPLATAAPTGTGDGSSLDLAVLAELRADLEDDDFVQEIIDRFVATTAGQVEAMQVAHRTGDHETLRTTAHTMKGTSATFGALRLAQLSTELQDAAANGATDRVHELLAAVATEGTRVAEHLGRYRATLRP